MNWQEISLALAGAAVLIIGAVAVGLKSVIAAWFVKLTNRVKRQSYIQEMEKLATFLEAFEGLKRVKNIDRCMLIRGHDSGGLPAAGKPYTVRSIHAWTQDILLQNPADKYDFEMQVDAHYIRLLEDVIKTGVSIQIFEEMPKEAKLRAFFEADGVKYARYYYLGLVDAELIYMSVASFTQHEFSQYTLSTLAVEIERMKSIIGVSD